MRWRCSGRNHLRRSSRWSIELGCEDETDQESVEKDRSQRIVNSLETKTEDCCADQGSNERDILVTCPSGDELYPNVGQISIS